MSFKVNDSVKHPIYGVGTVIKINGLAYTVKFTGGLKLVLLSTLSANTVSTETTSSSTSSDSDDEDDDDEDEENINTINDLYAHSLFLSKFNTLLGASSQISALDAKILKLEARIAILENKLGL